MKYNKINAASNFILFYFSVCASPINQNKIPDAKITYFTRI